MDYADNRTAQMRLRAEIARLRAQLKTLQQQPLGQAVDNATFETKNGPVSLRALFADESHLILIHNMGTGCNHCTLWADGLNGLYDHLRSKAAFVVSSPDTPAVQLSFASSRGWRFPMASDSNSDFARLMGYASEQGPMPGVSMFRREGDHIQRICDAPFGEDDLFCAVWPLFDMLGAAAADWEPALQYS